MTPDDTSTTCLRLCEVDREFPVFAKRDFGSNVLFLIARVNLVTCLAASTLGILVDMEKMHVSVAVSKVSKFRRKLVKSDVFIVAVETNGVVLRSIRHVKLRGKSFLQNFSKARAMWIMTSVTIVLFDRSVKEFRRLHLGTEILVTRVAELFSRRFELTWEIRRMSRVASCALLFF
jgi:hypothetical protein